MAKFYAVFFLFSLSLSVRSQTSMDYTVQANVTVQTTPPRISFGWNSDTTATGYSISRKLKGAANWTVINGTLPGNATQFDDTSVAVGNAFEYRIIKNTQSVTGITYFYSGIEVPAIEYRGRIILVVDSSFTVSLQQELEQLSGDLVNDGWQVIRHDVSPTDSVKHVKNLIAADYYADIINTKCVFLFGHVPVPYSGNINPDGHPDHQGAWPADVYYADMNGAWTDVSVNNASASRIQNQNIPGDGKFDQSMIPTATELQIGRVDFANLTAFSVTEEELLRRYLVKNHNYRLKNFEVRPRALVDDNFGAFGGEAFGSNGWRLCAEVGADSVTVQDYFTTLQNESYQWSYGCGGGSYTSCGGVGTTNDFVADSIQTIFSMLFGSYFGDWDSQNNFMRSSLASGTALTCSWAGRPHWQYHHMALGEYIGYSAFVTQNNSNTYNYNYAARFVHIALMGDPTLRMHMVAPPKNLMVVAPNLNQINLTWTASADSVLGYYVYRQDTSGSYVRISPNIVTTLNYVDSNPLIYNNKYMVRAVKLQPSASGTYFNLSTGISDSVLIANGSDELNAAILNASVFPNPAHGNFTLQFYSITNEQTTVEVYNIQGQLMQTMKHAATKGINKLPVSFNTNVAGMYFVKVATKASSKFVKIVVE